MLLYFSGTGNTRYCAELLGKHLGETPVEMTSAMLRQPAHADIQSADSRIIFMFPTYSWGIPPVVKRLIKKARIHFPADAVVWMVTTCGDDCGLIAAEWGSLMNEVRLKSGACFSVQMPNTYVNMKGFDTDPEELAKRKIEAAAPRVKAIADAIAKGLPCADEVVEGRHPWIKTNIIRPYFDRFCMSARKFEVDAARCNACGLCLRSCPLENIVPDTGMRPTWGPNCALCMRCYHLCPNHAINYGRETENKGQYRYFLSKRK